MIADPTKNIIDAETEHLFMCFCTFVMNLKGKKISIQNVLVYILQEEKLRKILKEILSLDNDYEIVKLFLDYDPNIAKSKYVTKFLNTKTKEKKNVKSKSPKTLQ